MAIMKCGHSPNATTRINGKDIPYCVICDCYELEDFNNNILKDRKAKCGYCGKIVDSNENLPFFEYRPTNETDSYYCRCRGWN